MNNIKNQIKEELNEIANEYGYGNDISKLCWGGQSVEDLIDSVEGHYNEIRARFPNAQLGSAVRHYFC